MMGAQKRWKVVVVQQFDMQSGEDASARMERSCPEAVWCSRSGVGEGQIEVKKDERKELW